MSDFSDFCMQGMNREHCFAPCDQVLTKTAVGCVRGPASQTHRSHMKFGSVLVCPYSFRFASLSFCQLLLLLVHLVVLILYDSIFVFF